MALALLRGYTDPNVLPGTLADIMATLGTDGLAAAQSRAQSTGAINLPEVQTILANFSAAGCTPPPSPHSQAPNLSPSCYYVYSPPGGPDGYSKVCRDSFTATCPTAPPSAPVLYRDCSGNPSPTAAGACSASNVSAIASSSGVAAATQSASVAGVLNNPDIQTVLNAAAASSPAPASAAPIATATATPTASAAAATVDASWFSSGTAILGFEIPNIALIAAGGLLLLLLLKGKH